MILVALTLPVLPSCERPDPVEPMPREEFVEVIVALRLATSGASSQADFEARRQVILADAGVTDSALIAYVRAHAGELAFMASVWDSVEARIGAAAGDDAIR